MGKAEDWRIILEKVFEKEFFEAELTFREKVGEVLLEEKQETENVAVREFEKSMSGRHLIEEEICQNIKSIEKVKENLKNTLMPIENEFLAKGYILNGEDEEKLTSGYESEYEKIYESLFSKDENLAQKANREAFKASEIMLREHVRLTDAERVRKILEMHNQKDTMKSPDVKIEIKNTNNISTAEDIDSITQGITDKLCEIMAKSAEGFY